MDKVMGVFLFLRARLLEPSSSASLAAVLALIGVQYDPGVVQDILNVTSLVFGAIGFFVKEAKPLSQV